MKYQRKRRRTHPQTRPEDRLLPLFYPFDDPVPQRSCPTVDEVLTKAQFLSPLLYQIHCIGPVGFGFAHIYSEGPLKTRPYNWCRLWEVASATMKCDGLLRQGLKPQGGTMMANLLGYQWRTTKRFLAQRASGAMCVVLVPTRGQTTREPHERPSLNPDGGRWRPCETLSRGSAARIVLEDWYWCLLTHSSSRMGF